MLVIQYYEEYYQFAKMVEKLFDFHHNSIVDNMVVVEVVYKTVDNMDYNVEVAENMAHNEYHNCKFLQLIFVPFWN